jgi:hypothetical protein
VRLESSAKDAAAEALAFKAAKRVDVRGPQGFGCAGALQQKRRARTPSSPRLCCGQHFIDLSPYGASKPQLPWPPIEQLVDTALKTYIGLTRAKIEERVSENTEQPTPRDTSFYLWDPMMGIKIRRGAYSRTTRHRQNCSSSKPLS